MKESLLSFKGGIHPNYNKEITKEKDVKVAKVPRKIEIPLVQHIGAPAEPIVKVGEYVKMGQKIGQANGMISSNIHSSVSGTVLSIESKTQVGGTVPTIIIENDGKDVLDETIISNNINQLSSEQIVEKVKEAGIVGMGGATFPSHVKLCPPSGHKIDTVIINGAECEPYLNSDYRLMVEQPDNVLWGLKFIMKALNVDKGYIAIENNKPKAIKLIKKLCEKEHNIIVAVLKTKYPQGGEKQLIKAVTGREVPSKKLPSQIGCVIFNTGTATAIAKAVKTGIPLIERIVTVTGRGIKEPQNLLVRIGTTFRDIIEQCGGLKEGYSKIISGGPMMGIAQGSLDIAVTKGTSGVLVLMKDEVIDTKQYPCIKCARCVDGCPMGLLPIKIVNALQAGDLDLAMKLNLMDCIECGSCSYICPANRPLLQYIRLGKSKIRTQRH